MIQGQELRPLLEQNFKQKTERLSDQRKNQILPSSEEKISSWVNTWLCLTCNSGGFSEVRVLNYFDYVVFVNGIPTQILREPGIYPGIQNHEIKKVDMRVYYADLTNLQINDNEGMPYLVTARVSYSVKNSLLSTTSVSNHHRFVKKTAKVALQQILSNHPQKNWSSKLVSSKLQRKLQKQTDKVGVRIEKLFVQRSFYPNKLQKLFLAREEAQSYVSGQKILVEGALKIVQSHQEAMVHKDMEMTAPQAKNLFIELVRANKVNQLPIDFYKVETSRPPISPVVAMVMKRN